MKVQLICPGLLGPADLGGAPLPSTPALDRVLMRARVERTGPRDPLESLAEAFGLVPAPGADLPSASLCLAAQGLAPEPGVCWFHADPVHLRADRDRLLLFAGPALEVRPVEAESLAAAFNAHFAGDGLHLICPGPLAWYLRVDHTPRLRTSPLHRVVGRPLDAYLPTGPDAQAWVRWQNEAQMLFFSHPVNQERERQGRPALSGVWTWGGGVLPAVTGGPALTLADHPLGVGLAWAGGGRALGLDAWGQAMAPSGEVDSLLVFWERLWWPALEGDLGAWAGALGELEVLVADLTQALSAGRIRSLLLDDGDRHRFTLTRAGLRCLWRRRGALRDWIARRGPSA
jgi:hypothetical protein